jgi:hypothetical protein
VLQCVKHGGEGDSTEPDRIKPDLAGSCGITRKIRWLR